MKTHRIAVIGLGQRIAHVLAAMREVGWSLSVAGHVDPAPVGLPILKAFDIDLLMQPYRTVPPARSPQSPQTARPSFSGQTIDPRQRQRNQNDYVQTLGGIYGGQVPFSPFGN